MYCDFFGLRCRPFEDRADTQFCYAYPDWEEALAATIYELHHGRGVALVLGEAGTGKTLLIRSLLHRLNASDRVIVLTWPSMAGMDLMRETCKALGVTLPESDHHIRYYTRLRRHLVRTAVKGQRSILIIDQAENLADDDLEQLATLSDLRHDGGNLLSIVLIGQPKFRSLLDSPRHERIAQRLSSKRPLRPLSGGETSQYIRHRLRVAGAVEVSTFADEAVALIHTASNGIPRLINRMADAAMVGAYGAGESRVTSAIAAEMLGEQTFIERTAAAHELGVSTAERIAAGLTEQHHAQVLPERSLEGQAADTPVVAAVGTGPVSAVSPDGMDVGLATFGGAGPSEQESDEINLEPSSGFEPTGLPTTFTEGVLTSAEAKLRCLERASARAERVSATADASFVKYEAAERHLTSLIQNAEGLVSGLTKAVGDAAASVDRLRDRANQILSEAEARLRGMETQAGETSELAQDMDAQKRRVEQVCKHAGQVESRLRSSAEHIADKADELQQRIAVLIGGLESAQEAQRQLDGLLTRVTKATDNVDERVTLLHERQIEAETSVRESAESAQSQFEGVITKASSIRADAEQSISTLHRTLDEVRGETQRLQKEWTSEIHVRLRHELNEQFETEMRTRHDAMERAIAMYRTTLAEMVDDCKRQIANLGEAVNVCRRKTGDVVAESQQSLTGIQASVTTTTERLRGEIAALSARGDQLRSLLTATAEELEDTERRAGGIAGTVHVAESSITELTDRAGAVKAELAPAVQRCERLIGNVQSTQHEVEAIQRGLASTLTELGTAAERADVLQKQIARGEESLSGLASGREEGERVIERLHDATSTARETLQATQQAVEEASGHYERLDARCTVANRTLHELSKASEAGQAVVQQSESATDSVTEAAENAKKQADQLSATQVSAEHLLQEFDGIVVSAKRTKEELRTILAETGVKSERLESQTTAATRMLSGLTEANETGCVLVQEAKRAGEAVSAASGQAREQTERLGAAQTTATKTTQQLDELARSAGQLHESMQGVVAHVDEKIGQLVSHQAAATHLLRRLAEENVTGHTIAERVDNSTNSCSDAIRALEQKAQELTERVEGRIAALQTLAAQTENGTEQLNTCNERALHLIEGLQSAGEPAKDMVTQLGQRIEQAQQTTEVLTHRYEEARELPNRLRAVARILKAAKTTGLSIEETAGNAKTMLEGLEAVTKRAAEQGTALKELTRTTLPVIETLERITPQSQQAVEQLESRMAAAKRSAEISGPMINEFVKQAQALRQQLQELHAEVETVEEGVTEATAKPAELIESAQAQAAQLERVCGAVQKVFKALSQATLDAKKHSTTCQVTADRASTRLAELTAETNRATATLHEWVEEALRVQSRLEKTLHECPSIRATHPGSVVRRIANVVESADRIANPSASELKMLQEPSSEKAPAQERLAKRTARKDEVSRLIQEAKSTVASANT